VDPANVAFEIETEKGKARKKVLPRLLGNLRRQAQMQGEKRRIISPVNLDGILAQKLLLVRLRQRRLARHVTP